MCKVNNCINNADGYCMCVSYVSIDCDGKCDLMELRNTDFDILDNVNQLKEKFNDEHL